MPFPRNIFTRRAERKGELSPELSKELGSPISPMSPKSPKFPKTPKSHRPLTLTQKNTEYLDQCLGCNNVADLIRRNTAYSKNGEARLSPVLLHNDFEELESCAKRCQICRVFRQSLLLEEVMFDGVRELRKTKKEVVVRWKNTDIRDDELGAYLTISVEDRPSCTGVINCTRRNEIAHLALRTDARDIAVMEQAKSWLVECVEDHVGDCDNLRFSRENPVLLVEIISNDFIRLCENQDVEYVALSYCWGVVNDEVRRGMTFDENLGRRRKGFSTNELPATIRDALYIVQAMGVRYAWVDSLCRNQSNGDGVATMHKVYSNALFTICVCATNKASGMLLERREAWSLEIEPCQLGGRWLTTPDMSLNELRLRSPLAKRAWTLQEERLSPRMLYVSSSRMYWSCARGCKVELAPTYGNKVTKMQRPVYATSDHNMDVPLAQEFLVACYDRKRDLHVFWADTVKSYALRSMSEEGDRLAALSGLAAKYLSANGPDEYLAGLWANNLAEGLAWKVQQAAKTRPRGTDSKARQWPSWSWAALPLETKIETVSKGARSIFFERVVDCSTMTSEVAVDPESSIEKGAATKELHVTGRLRGLWRPSSRLVDWSSIAKPAREGERFSYSANPEQDMHAHNAESGRVLVYEGRQKEVVGQLDYRYVVSQSDSPNWMALEIGETTMLLLETCSRGVYRRVGVAWDVRNNYFALAKQASVILT